jgi:TniQ
MHEDMRQWAELSLLPQRKVPWPWEDLASVVSRTAEAMGYSHPSWILHPELAEHRIAPEDLPLLGGQESYQMLGRLLGLDEATLRSLTLHRFTMGPDRATESANSMGEQHGPGHTEGPRIQDIYPLFRSYQRIIQVCPCCLAEPKSYDRLYWRATPLLLCPRHRVFLIQSCSLCRRPIPTPRLYLNTCTSCGGDFRQQVVPLPPEASWLLNTHLVLLTRLGVDASELGELPANDEASFLRDLSPHEYLWIISQFLVLFEDRLYRKALLPFFLRALPVETLVPGAPQSPYLILHYLLTSWPVHWWVFLERFQHALGQDLLWWGIRDVATRRWEKLLAEGDCWQQGIDKERTIVLLRSFFDAVESSFQNNPHSSSRMDSFDGQAISSEILLARQVRSPRQADLVRPHPWEDLASVIGRVARRMRCGDPAWILISEDLPRQKINSLDIPLLHRHDDYRFLSRQLRLDEETLYRLTLHRFATRLQPPAGDERASSPSAPAFSNLHGLPLLTDATALQYCATLRNTKVCPACLEEEAGYDRLFWRLRPVILCPVHSLLLTDHCPHCRAAIPGLRPALTWCPYCQHGDYRQAPHLSIPPTSWLYAGQLPLMHELTSEHVGDGEGPAAFAESPALLIAPWQYFSLWRRFRKLQLDLSRSIIVRALWQLAWDDRPPDCGSMAIEIEASETALFHFLLASWPENLLALLNQVVSQPITPRPGGGIYEHFWQFDQLVQHLWSSLAQTATSFDFLLHLFETLHAWAALSLQ